MGYQKQVYDKGWQQLAKRRQSAVAQTTARRQEIIKAIPRIAQIEREMASGAAGISKMILTSPDKAQQYVQQLAKKNLSLQDEMHSLLIAGGYQKDYLNEIYACELCHDKGYLKDKMCSCFSKILQNEASAILSTTAPLKACTFDNFLLSYYQPTPIDDSGVIPEKRMAEIFNFCKNYAENFSTQSESLLMIGRTGLGKTHLSLGIAGAITQKGFGVIYSPTQKLMDLLESDKFSRDSDARENYIDNTHHVIGCDLLILDDLGSEFTTSFTTSLIYNIINTRQVEGRPTIINTNLDLSDIEDKYSQRMVSRLACGYKVLKFYGKDIRFIKKTQNR